MIPFKDAAMEKSLKIKDLNPIYGAGHSHYRHTSIYMLPFTEL